MREQTTKSVWLVSEHGYPMLVTLLGETKRSWVTGYKWRPEKLAKNKYRIISEDEAHGIFWAEANRWKISNHVAMANTAILRKIAELIGYQEPTK